MLLIASGCGNEDHLGESAARYPPGAETGIADGDGNSAEEAEPVEEEPAKEESKEDESSEESPAEDDSAGGESASEDPLLMKPEAYRHASSAKEAIAIFRTRIEHLPPEQADLEFADLERFYRADLSKLNEVFLREEHIQAFSDLRNPITPEDIAALQDEASKQLALDAIAGLYKLISGEGVVVPIVDYRALLQFKPVLSEATGAYLELMARESDEPVISDAAIVIPWSELGERAVAAEHYLIDYPDSLYYEKMMIEYQSYLWRFLNGSDNTYVFEERGQFREKVRRGFDALLAEHGDSFTAEILRTYLDLVHHIVEQIPPSDEPYNDPIFVEIGKFLNSLESRIAERFGGK